MTLSVFLLISSLCYSNATPHSNATVLCKCDIPRNYITFGGGIIILIFLALFISFYSIYCSNSNYNRSLRNRYALLNN